MPKLFLLLSLISLTRPGFAHVYMAVPEPTTKSLMNAGIITLTLLAIFLRKKLG